MLIDFRSARFSRMEDLHRAARRELKLEADRIRRMLHRQLGEIQAELVRLDIEVAPVVILASPDD